PLHREQPDADQASPRLAGPHDSRGAPAPLRNDAREPGQAARDAEGGWIAVGGGEVFSIQCSVGLSVNSALEWKIPRPSPIPLPTSWFIDERGNWRASFSWRRRPSRRRNSFPSPAKSGVPPAASVHKLPKH